MKKILFLLLTATAVICCGKDFQIYKDGIPQAVIVPLQPGHRFAGIWANDFSRFAGECTGTKLPISKTRVPGKNTIELNFRDQGFTDDSFTIEFPDKNTMRISGTRNSVKSGIVYILEKYFGVRFLMHYHATKKRLPGYEKDLETDCPVVKNVAVPMTKVTKMASVNIWRHIYKHDHWYTRIYGFTSGHGISLWAFPIGKYAPDNSWPKEILPVLGGKKAVLPKYNKKLPNPWTPYRHGWQPCWSNPASVKIAVENLRELFERSKKSKPHPIHGKPYHVELSVNDNGGCCQCRECLKVVNGKLNSIGSADYSSLYWTWIKNVALEIKKTHPEKVIIAYAYREVFDPPAFDLPDNVMPQICREILTGSREPAERARIEKTFKEWSKRAKTLLTYDYLDSISMKDCAYMLPRVHMKSYADMFRMVYRYNVRGVYLEACNDIPMSGPTLYLISRLYWDINTDLDAHFKEWCERAVGKKAAPFLMEYYLKWENYWLRPEIRKTAWGLSHTGTYMPLNESGTYTYPITEKDVAEFDALMNKTVALADTPQRKRRAELFKHLWELSRKSLICLYAPYLEYDGTVASAENAVKLINSIPEAAKAQKELANDPYVPKKWNELVSTGICNFKGLIPHLKDKKVRAALDKILKNRELPLVLRASLEIVSGVKYKNELADGSFETWKGFTTWLNKGVLDSTHVTDGKKAYKVLNGGVTLFCKAEYGKHYMVMLDVYSPATGGEGRLELITNPRSGNGKYNTQYHAFKGIRVNKGWQTLSNTIHVSGFRNQKKADSVWVHLCAKFFENDQPIWIDNVRIYKLD